MFKSFKKKKPVIRNMQEIQQAYNELCMKLGQASYQEAVFKDECARIRQLLLEVNKEAAERNRLDSEAKPKVEPIKQEGT